jgi:hypothetical protein
MKLKLSCFFALLFLTTFESNAKRNDRIDENDYAISKHEFMFSVGYATPSIVRSFLKHQTSREDIVVSGVGPLLAKTEFMISNRFGICINASYSNYKVSWYQDSYDTILQKYRPFEMGIKSYELAGTVRGNYHFWKRAKIDSYAGIGVGYGLFHIGGYTTAHTTIFSFQFDLPPTLSLECTYGIKYFPIRNVGIFAEVGLGKSWILFDKYFIPDALVQAGISFKL